MNKELEVLIERIRYLGDKDMYNGVHIQIADRLQELLTPPTEEEVCKALSDYFEVEVYYQWNLKSFYMHNGIKKNGGDDKTIVTYATSKFFKNGHQIIFYKILTVKLINMIGRFYEGQANEH